MGGRAPVVGPQRPITTLHRNGWPRNAIRWRGAPASIVFPLAADEHAISSPTSARGDRSPRCAHRPRRRGRAAPQEVEQLLIVVSDVGRHHRRLPTLLLLLGEGGGAPPRAPSGRSFALSGTAPFAVSPPHWAAAFSAHRVRPPPHTSGPLLAALSFRRRRRVTLAGPGPHVRG